MVNRYAKAIFGIVFAGAVCICEGQEISNAVDEVVDEGAEAVATEVAEEANLYDRSRYDVIVARSPFGSDPIGDEDEKQVTAAAQALEREYRLCFLLESQTGEVRAGFQNLKAKKGDPKSVMLMVGESHGSMRLMDIDLENSSATLQYQGREVTFELSKATVSKASAPPASTPPNQPQRRFGSGFRRTTPPEPAAVPEPQISDAELEAQRQAVQDNLREYQMEVIRQGMPPLPIQLTPEQDDQLVAEGVLDPLE